jgi:single-strand DNA-binding protein
MNKVMLIGNVGKDPEIRYVDAGVCVASLVLATTERGYKLQNGTEVPDRTEWHNIVCWGKTAEVIEKYVHKGSSVYIQGKLHTRTYEKDGQKHYATEIECETMQMLDRKTDNTVSTTPQQTERKDDNLPF